MPTTTQSAPSAISGRTAAATLRRLWDRAHILAAIVMAVIGVGSCGKTAWDSNAGRAAAAATLELRVGAVERGQAGLQADIRAIRDSQARTENDVLWLKRAAGGQ